MHLPTNVFPVCIFAFPLGICAWGSSVRFLTVCWGLCSLWPQCCHQLLSLTVLYYCQISQTGGRFWGFVMREATISAFAFASTCRSLMSPNRCSWLPLDRSVKPFKLCGNSVMNFSRRSWSILCRAKVFRVTASRTDFMVFPTSPDMPPFSAFTKSSATFIILYENFTNVWTFWRAQSAFRKDGMAPCRMVNLFIGGFSPSCPH